MSDPIDDDDDANATSSTSDDAEADARPKPPSLPKPGGLERPKPAIAVSDDPDDLFALPADAGGTKESREDETPTLDVPSLGALADRDGDGDDGDDGGDDDAPRERSATFMQRKEDARAVGLNTGFVDDLTAGLIREGLVSDDAGTDVEVERVPVRTGGTMMAVDAPALDEIPAAATAKADAAKADATKAGSAKVGSAKVAVAAAAKTPPKAGADAPAAAAAPPREAISPLVLGVGAAAIGLLLLFGWQSCRNRADKTSDGAGGDQIAAGTDATRLNAADGAAAGNEGGGAGGGAADAADGAASAGGADGGAEPTSAGGNADGGGGDGATSADGAAAGEGEDEGAPGTGDDGADGSEAAGSGGEADGDVVVVEDDDGGGDGEGKGGGGRSTPKSAGGAKDPSKVAEDEMSAAELLAAAKEALSAKSYADAYRLAGKAHRKKASEAALVVRVEAACGMKNKNTAKSSFDKITTGKTKRDLRAKCRDKGVRLGL
jgi:hypothetical protein